MSAEERQVDDGQEAGASLTRERLLNFCGNLEALELWTVRDRRLSREEGVADLDEAIARKPFRPVFVAEGEPPPEVSQK